MALVIGTTYSLFQVQISAVYPEALPCRMIKHKILLEICPKEQSYNDISEKLGCWILGKMYLFRRISFPIIGIKKTARKGEKMSEGHDRLCRFETCFLRIGSLDDNGVTKFREVVSHRSVESDFALLD